MMLPSSPRSNRVPRLFAPRATAPLIALAAALISCAPTYSLLVDVPPRRAPTGISGMVVQDFVPPGWGPSFSQELRGRISGYGFIQTSQAGGGPLLTGQVSVSQVRRTPGTSVQQVEEKQNGQKYVRNVTVYRVRSQAEVSVSYALVQAGRTLATGTYGREYDQTRVGSTAAEALANSDTDDQIVGSLLGPLVEEVARDVSPHKQKSTIALRTGEHPGLEQGVQYMKHGRFEQAFAIWDQVVEQSTTASDRAAALYDMGVIREVRGEYSDAFDMFSKADSLQPGDDEIIEALTRVEQKKVQQARIQQPALPAVGAPPPSGAPATGEVARFTVRTDPPGARVRIMNIPQSYRDQIELPVGRYDLMVDAPGYAPRRQWVNLGRGDFTLDVRLTPK